MKSMFASLILMFSILLAIKNVNAQANPLPVPAPNAPSATSPKPMPQPAPSSPSVPISNKDKCYKACEEGANLATKFCEIYKEQELLEACWSGRNNSESGCNTKCQEHF